VRVAIVSTYPPRPCGIGTFTSDLRGALGDADPTIEVDIVSLSRDDHGTPAPEVVANIRQDVHSDYPATTRTLASRGTDVVLIEHEYGIYGGAAGSFVTSLADGLAQPLVVTLHTVLAEPSVREAEALRALCQRATLVTVFTETARTMVAESLLVPPERVRVVPHGAPTALLPDSVRTGRAALERLEEHTVLSTFGLISAGKGVEVVIEALPALVARRPDLLYLVAGTTHPEVVKHEGERYRLSLERLVRDLDLTEHVHFLDRFLTVDELSALLAATDLYVAP
jgi:glycosyltransferase involved in cell wall biosynthesis